MGIVSLLGKTTENFEDGKNLFAFTRKGALPAARSEFHFDFQVSE